MLQLAWLTWQTQNGKTVTNAVNAVVTHTQKVIIHLQGDVKTAVMMNQLQRIQYFITSSLIYFYGVFRYCKKKGISSYELAKEIGVSQTTAWLFHCKLQQTMQSSGKHPLSGKVHIDEYVTGGPEPGKPGRSIGKKKKTLIMVELRDDNKTGRVYCQQITNYKKLTLYPIIEVKVASDAAVVTDQYPSYDKLKEKFPEARQIKSNKGKAFPEVHQQIMNMKGWLRGIHHQCSEKHYQKYLDEYCFRTNRRNTEQGIFKAIMLRVAKVKTKTFKELTAYAYAA